MSVFAIEQSILIRKWFLKAHFGENKYRNNSQLLK
jgi:hypothetical protein